MSYLEPLCRALLVTVFALAVRGKLKRGALAELAGELAGLGPVRRKPWHQRLWRTAAVAVAVTEASIVLALCLPGLALPGFALAVLLTAAFTGGVALSIRTGRRVRCRCFGASDAVLGPRQLIRNAILLLVALLGTVAAAGDTAAGPAGTAVGLALGLLGGLLLVHLDDLSYLWSAPTGPAGRH